MHHGNCSCPHHWADKIMMLLVWVAGVIFFWTSWRVTSVWGFEAPYYAWAVVVLSLMAHSMKKCGCCGGGMMGEGKDCKACMGMGGEHTHDHK